MSKVLLIGDTHSGENGNSPKYNQQVNDMYTWVTQGFPDVDYVVHLGDWFHARNKIQIDTLNYGIKGAKILQKAYGKDNVYVLCGNHDTYHLTSLEVSSLAAIEPYVTVIDEITQVEDMLLVPWIVSGEEWDKIFTYKTAKFCLSHFELNGFYVTDTYKMDHGFSPKALNKSFDLTISGHYHSPQRQGNIQYAGTPIPITMSEANEDHGVWVLDTETGGLDFHVYDKVKVISIPYDELADVIDDLDPENTSIRVEFPDELEDETIITEVRELLDEMKFSSSKIKYRGQKAKQLLESTNEEVEEVENIDQAVLEFLEGSTEVSGIDNTLMKKLYLKSKELSKEEQE